MRRACQQVHPGRTNGFGNGKGFDMGRIFIAVVVSVVAAGLFYSGVFEPQKDKVINFADDDAQMNEAIAAARKTLPLFWTAFSDRQPGDDGFSIKVHIEQGQYGEHFWTRDVEKSGAEIHARIANDPNGVTSVKLGQRIRVNPEQISDWTYWRNGMMQGAYTLRVMLPRLPKEQAAQFRARLAPLPTPQ